MVIGIYSHSVYTYISIYINFLLFIILSYASRMLFCMSTKQKLSGCKFIAAEVRTAAHARCYSKQDPPIRIHDLTEILTGNVSHSVTTCNDVLIRGRIYPFKGERLSSQIGNPFLRTGITPTVQLDYGVFAVITRYLSYLSGERKMCQRRGGG